MPQSRPGHRLPYVTRDAVIGVLATNPGASLREIRIGLGGGSLSDISKMVKAVRGKNHLSVRDALAKDPDLAATVVDILQHLAVKLSLLQAEVSTLHALLSTRGAR